MFKLLAVLMYAGLMQAPAISHPTPTWLPANCLVGDVSDSYDGDWYMCAKVNHWSRFESGYKHLYRCSDGVCGDMWQDGPHCRLFFRDSDQNGHCPWESATGRVTACAPCLSNKGYDGCKQWYSECLEFLSLEKRYQTAEPTRIDVKAPRADHTLDYECPDEWAIHWLSKRHDYSEPICIRPKP